MRRRAGAVGPSDEGERWLIPSWEWHPDRPSRTEVEVTFEGFAGDRHAGLTMASGSRTPQYPRGTEIRNSRQVSCVSQEDLDAVAGALGLP